MALGGICSERFNLAILRVSESLILQSEKFLVPRNDKLKSTGTITTVPLENKFLKSDFSLTEYRQTARRENSSRGWYYEGRLHKL